jgi:hypothetical protein
MRLLTTSGELGDYHWVDIGPLGPHRSAASVQPYFGPGWYGRASVAFLLDAGIAQWPDVKLTFSAVVRRPAEFLAERLRLMDELWTTVGQSFQGEAFLEGRSGKPRDLAKYASSALFGVWG